MNVNTNYGGFFVEFVTDGASGIGEFTVLVMIKQGAKVVKETCIAEKAKQVSFFELEN
jgi:NADP-dependent 3-hydroxy acid dehydrogenase YdfG